MIQKIIFAIAGTLLMLAASELSAQCKVKPIVKNCMPMLKPYQYDSYAVKEIAYSAKAKKEILEFSVYSDEEYKLVFGKTSLPQEVGIVIYDKHPGKKDKKLLYFDESGKKGDFVFNFQPKASGTYFIEFDIPPASAPEQKGCFVLLIGIKD